MSAQLAMLRLLAAVAESPDGLAPFSITDPDAGPWDAPTTAIALATALERGFVVGDGSAAAPAIITVDGGVWARGFLAPFNRLAAGHAIRGARLAARPARRWGALA